MFSRKATEMNEPPHLSAKEGSKTVNPQWHDEFVALCALFPSGELTEEEWALLQVHLAYCDICRLTFAQYEQIASDVVPLMAVTAASEPNSEQTPSAFSLEVAEQRLIRRLDSQPNREAAHSRRPSWPVIAGSLAACLTLTFWLVEMRLHHPTPQLSAQSAPVA